MNIVLFEDEQVTQLYPVTLSRAAFAIHCGSYRLIDLADNLGPPVGWHARPHLQAILAADFPRPALRAEGPCMLVNAALVPSISSIRHLQTLCDAGEPCLVKAQDRVAMAVLPRGTPAPEPTATPDDLRRLVAKAPLPRLDLELPLFEYPHDIVRHHLAILNENLEHRLAHGEYRELAPGVFAAEGALLGPHAVTDSQRGPIVLEAGARVGPFAFLSGPAHVGRGARLLEHAAIKDGVALGHTTKIGGEVEASIVEPYTNKQHHGFLGHSYLGSWINLGAGTCNSDLKNTYGLVNMDYQGKRVATGMQFIGAMIGDYSKTAINTGIFTGKTIGACSMVYGFVTTNVPSFVNYARLFGQVTETPPDVMISTQARMFARRQVEQRPCDIQLLRDMYELTRDERVISGDPLML